MSPRSLLLNKSVRATPARVAIMEVLQEATLPLDVTDIIANTRVAQLQIDLVTVYRTIELLTTQKLINRIELHEGKFRYELASRDHHHHAICKSCGAIEDVSDCIDKDVEEKIARRTGFFIESHSLEFFGFCKSCQKNKLVA